MPQRNDVDACTLQLSDKQIKVNSMVNIALAMNFASAVYLFQVVVLDLIGYATNLRTGHVSPALVALKMYSDTLLRETNKDLLMALWL